MPYGDRKSQRVDFERGIRAYIVGIDGTWRRDCMMVDVSQTGARLCVEGSLEGLDFKEFFLLLSSTGLAYLLQLGTSSFHLRPREVLVAIDHGLELAAIDGNTRRRQEAHLAAEFDEARTYLAKRQAIVFAEVRDCLVIRCEPTQQPHDLDIASGFSFEPPARLNPVQIAVNVKLEENRRVVRGPTSRRRLNPFKAHLSQIECIDKYVDHPNRVALVNEIIEAFGQ